MSCELLGQHFDIHGGGADLQFPHHENEIAQSEGALYGSGAIDQPFVRYWMHNGHIRVNHEKMSKSLGNFFLIKDVLAQFDPEVVRFFMLKAHYRSPINYSDHQLEEARTGLTRLYTALSELPAIPSNKVDPAWRDRFAQAMNDDFNTPIALSHLFEAVRVINSVHDGKETLTAEDKQALEKLMHQFVFDILGLKEEQTPGSDKIDGLMQMILQQRVDAKTRKDYATSDLIRDKLKELGFEIKDGKEGTTYTISG